MDDCSTEGRLPERRESQILPFPVFNCTGTTAFNLQSRVVRKRILKQFFVVNGCELPFEPLFPLRLFGDEVENEGLTKKSLRVQRESTGFGHMPSSSSPASASKSYHMMPRLAEIVDRTRTIPSISIESEAFEPEMQVLEHLPSEAIEKMESTAVVVDSSHAKEAHDDEDSSFETICNLALDVVHPPMDLECQEPVNLRTKKEVTCDKFEELYRNSFPFQNAESEYDKLAGETYHELSKYQDIESLLGNKDCSPFKTYLPLIAEKEDFSGDVFEEEESFDIMKDAPSISSKISLFEPCPKTPVRLLNNHPSHADLASLAKTPEASSKSALKISGKLKFFENLNPQSPKSGLIEEELKQELNRGGSFKLAKGFWDGLNVKGSGQRSGKQCN